MVLNRVSAADRRASAVCIGVSVDCAWVQKAADAREGLRGVLEVIRRDPCFREYVTFDIAGVLRRIASLFGVRRGKVLNIRRQIAQGTYNVEDRLERATDRVLEEVSGYTRIG